MLDWLLNLLRNIISRLFPKALKPSEAVRDVTAPDTSVRVVEDRSSGRAYRTPAMLALLAAIRSKESGSAGYNADFRNDDRWPLTTLTLDEAQALGRLQVVRDGEASSAIGAYQFLTKTLISLRTSLHLTGGERFDELFQDDLAVALMIRRGYMRLMRDELSAEEFSNNLAKEWASLPVVIDMQGAFRAVRRGQSYYSGDGLNAALHKPEAILELVRAVQQEKWQ